MNYEKSNLILLNENDIDFFLKKQKNFNRVYAFTPNIYSKAQKLKIKNCHTLSQLIDNRLHLKIISIVKNHEKIFYNNFNKINKFNKSIFETIRSTYNVLCNRSIYVYLILKKITFPIIVIDDSKYYEFKNLKDLHNIAIKKLSKNKVFYPTSSKNLKFNIFKYLVDLINDALIGLISKNKTILVSGFVYGINNISNQIIKNFNHRVIYLDFSNKYIFLKSIIFFLHYLFRKKKLSIPIPIDKINHDIKMDLDKIFNKINNDFILNGFDANKEVIYSNSIFNYSIYNKVEKIIKTLNPLVYLAHEMKFCDNAMIAEIINNNNINSLLISHGSHTKDFDKASKYVNAEIARGLIDSQFCKYSFRQSPITKMDYGINNNKKILDSYPIMWSINNYKYESEKTFNIIYQETSKDFAARPWSYETPTEMLSTLIFLIKKLENIKNLKLLIRFKSSDEMSFNTIKNLLPKSSIYKIKEGGSFSDDSVNANLVISNSSTTLEESLYSRIPVLLFNKSLRYDHIEASNIFPNKNTRYPAYKIDDIDMLLPMVVNIIKFHGKNKLNDNELKDYIWKDKKNNFEEIFKFL